MKATEVKTGQTYRVKVGHNSTEVKIISVNPKGGWEAVNVRTGKPVNIKSASRIVSASKPDATKEPGASKPADDKEKPNRAKRGGKLSGLDAAARVLAESGQPLNTTEMVDIMFERNLWKSDGATPAATIYSAIIREIKTKGSEARFRKEGRGKFTAAKS